jgi:hypothetical protein
MIIYVWCIDLFRLSLLVAERLVTSLECWLTHPRPGTMGLLHLLSSERSKHLLFNAEDRDQTSVTIVRWPMCKTISSSSTLLDQFLVLVLVPPSPFCGPQSF